MPSGLSTTYHVLPANPQKKRVDPRGLEPLTSAMRGRREEFASVCHCSKNGLFERNSLSPPFSPFTSVCPGNCQVTVKSPSDQGSCPRFMRVEARLACCVEQYLLLL